MKKQATMDLKLSLKPLFENTFSTSTVYCYLQHQSKTLGNNQNIQFNELLLFLGHPYSFAQKNQDMFIDLDKPRGDYEEKNTHPIEILDKKKIQQNCC